MLDEAEDVGLTTLISLETAAEMSTVRPTIVIEFEPEGVVSTVPAVAVVLAVFVLAVVIWMSYKIIQAGE